MKRTLLVENSNKKQCVNPFIDESLKDIIDNPNFEKIFYDSLLICIKNDIEINSSIFKVFCENFNYRASTTKKDKIVLDWFISYIRKTKTNTNYVIAYLSIILNDYSPGMIKKYKYKFFLDINSAVICKDDLIISILKKSIINTFPYLYFMHLYEINDEVDGYNVRNLNQNEFKMIFEKYGKNFFLNPNIMDNYLYMCLNKNWSWKPKIDKRLKEEIMLSINDYQELSNCYLANLITKDDVLQLMKTNAFLFSKVIDIKWFYNIFKDCNSIYGKFCRSFSQDFVDFLNKDYHEQVYCHRYIEEPFFRKNLYENFKKGKRIFNENDKILLIRNIIPIYPVFFDTILSSIDVFKEALSQCSETDILRILPIINIVYCENLNINLPIMRRVISDRLSNLLQQYSSYYNQFDSPNIAISQEEKRMQSFYQMTIPFTNRAKSMSLFSIYFVSKFFIDNREYCFRNSIYFRFIMLSNALSDIQFKLSDVESLEIEQIPNYQHTIENTLDILRSSPIYIFLTKKIYWIMMGEIIPIISSKVYNPLPMEMFTGINLFWNKLNTVCVEIMLKSFKFKYFLRIVQIFNSFESTNFIDSFLIGHIFHDFYQFAKNFSDLDIVGDLFKLLKTSHIVNIQTNIKTHFISKKIICSNQKKKISKMIYTTSHIKARENLKDIMLTMPIEEAKKKIELTKNELIEKYRDALGIKQCPICYDYSKMMVKLDCNCVNLFCLSCISDMRGRNVNFCINCPTCRKLTSQNEDKLYYYN